MVASGAGIVPAQAEPGSYLQLIKQVDGQEAHRGLAPGESVTYRIEFSAENYDADGPVTLTDVLPAAFSGWEISEIAAALPGYPGTVSVDLPGVSPATGGVIGSSEADRTVTVDVAAPIDGGATGLPTGPQGWLEYTVTVPATLSPDWDSNGLDLVNSARITAIAAPGETISAQDSATVSVDVERVIDVTPTKSWTPAGQGYEPGAPSTIVIGGTQASNVDAAELVLQDPPVADDGAGELDASNPFRYVDFAGFTADPADPANWPAGATAATVEVYVLSGGSWSWVGYSGGIADADIAGVRIGYTGAIVPGAEASASFTVSQREDDRLGLLDISKGYEAENVVAASVSVTGEDPVTRTADAPFAVTPLAIAVEAGKTFVDASGTEVEPLRTTAGNTVGAILTAQNRLAPQSAALDSLTISEPGEGADAAYFSNELRFAGFDAAYTTQVWPAGATGGTLTWQHDGGPTVVVLTPGEALPAVPTPLTNRDITGFELSFTGSIAPGATSQVKYAIDTDEGLASDGAEAGPFRNAIDVTGTRPGVDEPAEDSADATLTVVSPKIEVEIEKRISPSVVLPGDDVIVQLPTTATASGDKTKPTEIVVEDTLTGDGTFWDAYDATAILAPIDVPAGSTLTIQRYDAALGDWVDVDTLTASSMTDIALPSPETTTGIRFVYRNTDGFGATTTVKPNLAFTARETLRSSGEPTAPGAAPDYPATPYENTATAESTGILDEREVHGEDLDTGAGSIRPEEWVGPGPLWAAKQWTDSALISQSGAESSTIQSWAVTERGFDEIRLTDPATPNATGVGTVFEAFDLTRVFPIAFDDDPQLAWDAVTAVQLWNGAAWTDAAAPAGGWMNGAGFVGYTLSAAERGSTLGVRLVLAPNDDARAAAIADGDLGVPAVGSGIAASASTRGYELGWKLRDSARTAAGDDAKWVVSTSAFNCLVAPAAEADAGCIDNVFEIAGDQAGTTHRDTDGDTITVLDGVAGVSLAKTVGGLADGRSVALVAPKPGDLDPADYPTTWYTLTARNASGAGIDPVDAVGVMKLGKVRVTDVATSTLGTSGMSESPFSGRDFDAEAASGAGNHFDEFDLTGISFEGLPSYIDTAQSTLELWLYAGGTPTTAAFSIDQITGAAPGGPTAAQLADAIGVSVVYQGTDPETNGNRIVAGDALTMRLDVQLRASHRASGAPVTGGADGVSVPVDNSAAALGQDLVVDPAATPRDVDDAQVLLTDAAIDVELAKRVTVDNRDGQDDGTVYEATRDAPVHVLLTATPGASKAPLDRLSIEDTTAEFWDLFELVSLPAPTAVPTDSDAYRYDYFVAGAWVAQADFAGELADVRGVRITFDRADGALFPLGATSWTSDWGEGRLPIDVRLRAGAEIDWAGGLSVENVAATTATGSGGATADDGADASLGFSEGSHELTVQKRAPLDTSTHTVEAMSSAPWQLVVANSGTGYLPLGTVTDVLPAELEWDGEQPAFSRTGGDGASIDPAEITVAASEDGRHLVFTWPAGTRMDPGEELTIDLGLVLQPGLTAADRAWNTVVAETGVELDACTQPTNNGQDPSRVDGLASTQCGNANYVQPRSGTLIGAQKFVNGEPAGTLGEDLVSGAVNVVTGAEGCTTPGAPADYTRTPCADVTAVGATDAWLLRHVNAGTTDLARMTIVDMLPAPGDKLLAGNASRNSTFRPVLADLASLEVTGLPAGATYAVEITTDPTACIGTAPISGWIADPECSDAATNAANGSWVAADAYAGAAEDIAGFRIAVTMGDAPLRPGAWLDVAYETVNRVAEQAEGGLQPTLAQFAEPQFAWNQNGVVAWDTAGSRVNLPKAPQPAGVTLQTGSLEVAKTVVDGGVTQIPESFDVSLVCTVPSGLADPARVALDLGESATLTLPADGTPVTVDGLPIGTDCTLSETGEVGAHGEVGRSFQVSDGVTPSVDGTTAEIAIRAPRSGDTATVAALTNTYALGELVVEKSVRSDNAHDLSEEQLSAEYAFLLECAVGGSDEPVVREFTLTAGAQQRFADLPQGAVCEVTETDAGEATSTSVTVSTGAAGETVEGTASGELALGETGALVLVSNALSGVPPVLPPGDGGDGGNGNGGDGNDPGGLGVTGGQVAGLIAAAVLLIALAGGAFALNRRRARRDA
ncbi:DUF5979 domain-containing protein [Leucobacter allii]|uniref:DUF5979 domain-containing protein n=1 Tax=Leucobacter allii TaxID=2932247 RepID=A0ABY4FM51_9MICO|nr:DUF5979 domain-containing protein [Leucobacter allii]UOQ57334.1 DUF5979 domain-containing protein [Leucobacter allii]